MKQTAKGDKIRLFLKICQYIIRASVQPLFFIHVCVVLYEQMTTLHRLDKK